MDFVSLNPLNATINSTTYDLLPFKEEDFTVCQLPSYRIRSVQSIEIEIDYLHSQQLSPTVLGYPWCLLLWISHNAVIRSLCNGQKVLKY